jgi:hypothetical protein
MWITPWNREDWVISAVGFRYLNRVLWAQIPFILALPFLIYCGYLALQGKTTPLTNLPMQVFCGLAGGICALSGLILDNAMQVFQRSLNDIGESTNRLGQITLKFRVFFGSAIYYWFFYRPKMLESGFRKR